MSQQTIWLISNVGYASLVGYFVSEQMYGWAAGFATYLVTLIAKRVKEAL